MTMRKSIEIQGVIALLASAFVLSQILSMPSTVAVHFNAQGVADRYGSRWEYALVLLELPIPPLLTLLIPRLGQDPPGINRSILNRVMVGLEALFGAIIVVMMINIAHERFDMATQIVALVIAAFAFLGFAIGDVKPNKTMGIRTPWTFASEEVWTRTHHRARTIWLVTGTLGAVVCFVGVPLVIAISIAVAIALLPVLDSYLVYVQWKQKGSVD